MAERELSGCIEQSHKLAGIQDYLIFLLTGEWVTDLTFASRTNLLDLNSNCWSERMLEIFGVDEQKCADWWNRGQKWGC